MAQQRVYGGTGNFGIPNAALGALVLNQGVAGICSAPQSDIQNTVASGCFAYGAHNVTRFLFMLPGDLLVPDNASSVLVDFYVAARKNPTAGFGLSSARHTPGTGAVAEFLGFGDVSTGFTPAQVDGCSTNSLGQALTGTRFKAEGWGVLWNTVGGGANTTDATSFQIRVRFTLPAPTVVTTADATNLISTTATLNGTLNPNTATTPYPCGYKFEWGLTSTYGNTTSTVTGLTGSSTVNATTDISGLSIGTTYHYRLVAFNADQTVNGADKTFVAGITAVGMVF